MNDKSETHNMEYGVCGTDSTYLDYELKGCQMSLKNLPNFTKFVAGTTLLKERQKFV
jgi:hypothetical protein